MKRILPIAAIFFIVFAWLLGGKAFTQNENNSSVMIYSPAVLRIRVVPKPNDDANWQFATFFNQLVALKDPKINKMMNDANITIFNSDGDPIFVSPPESNNESNSKK